MPTTQSKKAQDRQELQKKAVSKTQQRLFGMVDAYVDGKLDITTLPKALQKKIQDIAVGRKGKIVPFTKGISKTDSHALASTKHKGLPERVKNKKPSASENFLVLDFETFVNEMYAINEADYYYSFGKLKNDLVVGGKESRQGFSDTPKVTIPKDTFVAISVTYGSSGNLYQIYNPFTGEQYGGFWNLYRLWKLDNIFDFGKESPEMFNGYFRLREKDTFKDFIKQTFNINI